MTEKLCEMETNGDLNSHGLEESILLNAYSP